MKNFIFCAVFRKKELIKDQIFLEGVLAINTTQELQSNLEKKDSPIILKDHFYQGQAYQYFH